MKTTLAIALSVVLAAGVVAANQLGAQTTNQAETGVPPASPIITQDPGPTTQPTETPTATTPTTPETPTTESPGASPGGPLAGGVATVQNIVEITRLVPAGTTAVTAFTVPAGVTLVVTDLLVTNTGTTATCGGAVNRNGTTAAPTPTTPTTPDVTSPTTPTTPAPGTTGAAVTTTVAGTLTQTDSTVTGPLCVPAQTTTTIPLTTGIEFAAGQTVQLVNTPAADPAATAPGPLGFHLRGLLVTLT